MSSSESRRQEVTEYRCDMLRKTVPDPYARRLEKLGRRRLRVEYGNRQFMRRSGMQTPSKLRLCWMMKFVSEV